jgi:hypothetical protein
MEPSWAASRGFGLPITRRQPATRQARAGRRQRPLSGASCASRRAGRRRGDPRDPRPRPGLWSVWRPEGSGGVRIQIRLVVQPAIVGAKPANRSFPKSPSAFIMDDRGSIRPKTIGVSGVEVHSLCLRTIASFFLRPSPPNCRIRHALWERKYVRWLRGLTSPAERLSLSAASKFDLSA